MQDYTTEITYISNYYCDLTPVHLAFIAAINNFPPPDIYQPFNYCELGCGCGKTTNIVAAAYPQASCVGIDINKDHIAIARNESKGISNIEFFDLSFGEALERDFQPFDFITMHGIWSWVGDSVRSDILEFVRKFLKPNGLFYVSYDAMPGWAQLQPFHKILSIYTRDKEANITEKAKAGMTYLQFLNENKSPFFEYSPCARQFLQCLDQSDIRYVIHELFNKNLRPEYFCDVAEAMKSADLSFVGDCVHVNNYQMMLTEPFRKLLNTTADKICRETHKSIMLNDRFRKDVYARCKSIPQDVGRRLECFEKFLFGAMKPLSELSLEVQIHGYTLTLNADPYLKIFEILASDQLSIFEINQKLKLPEDRVGETLENVINCMLTNQFGIFFRKKNTEEPLQQISFPSAYNLNQIMNWQEQYSKYIFLASEIVGDAFAISKQNAMIIAAICKFGLQKEIVVEYVHEHIISHIKNGNGMFGFSENQDIKYLISFHYEEITRTLLKTLQSLGIIANRLLPKRSA
ncbi:MAG: methyltransferase regulatory domain-containing protein [Holosporaceae bacterium]|jgi:SAM-dependent methyltransferase|nr:methyltransferase regulatory domain-containing protein [Holosporaceae bacterium]